MIAWLMYVDRAWHPLQKLLFLILIKGHLGAQGAKVILIFHESILNSSIPKKDMSLFHLSNDVQCSEALIRIKRLAEFTG